MDNQKNSKTSIVAFVAAVIVIGGAAVYYYHRPAPVNQTPSTSAALPARTVISTPVASSTAPVSQPVKSVIQKTGTATLSWNANTDADLAGYKIYYGTAPRTGSCPPGGYSNSIDVKQTATPKKPSYTLTNLQNGKTYYFSLTSYNQAGKESCFTPEYSKVMPAN